jgi:hypothetical protein
LLYNKRKKPFLEYTRPNTCLKGGENPHMKSSIKDPISHAMWHAEPKELAELALDLTLAMDGILELLGAMHELSVLPEEQKAKLDKVLKDM